MIIRTNDFIQEFSELTGHPYYDIKDLLRQFINYVCEKLSNGDEIKIRGFVEMGTVVRDEYVGTIAKTGQAVKYGQKVIPVIKFKQYVKEALDKVNQGERFIPLDK